MIIVVEGPSAAGKTTCATRLASASLVPETAGLQAPIGSSEHIARFWTDANAQRWQSATRMEAATGVAVCDTDPLKLHYDFCLVRIGKLGLDQLRAGVQTTRAAMASGAIGIADLVLCEIPEPDVLEQRKGADRVRTRHRFELHRRLAEPLREWYDALAQLEPDRVQWRFPDELPASVERDRYDLALFDAWMARLGTV